MNKLDTAGPLRLLTIAALLGIAGLISAACSSPVEPQATDAPRAQVTATDAYCQAVQSMLIAQPSGALGDEALDVSMNFYADAVERLAEQSATDDAVVLFELAATARLVGADPGDRVHAQRLGTMVTPVAAITVRASQRCGIAG